MFRRMLVAATVVVSLASLPAVAGAATVTVQAAGPNGSAGPFYTDSGVSIPVGGTATVTAEGEWTICGISLCTVGPDGIAGGFNPNNEDPTAPGGALIGSLDGGVTWFLIGSGPTVIDGPGELLLATNDASPTRYGTCGFSPAEGCWGDNWGFVNATITVTRPLPANTDQCKKDGWKSYGVFKNQGDCVSFVATKGKNAPAGS